MFYLSVPDKTEEIFNQVVVPGIIVILTLNVSPIILKVILKLVKVAETIFVCFSALIFFFFLSLAKVFEADK